MVALRRSLGRWRAAAIAASCVAVLLAAGFAARERYRPSAPREYVAILQKDAASPAFEVTVDLDRQELSVRPVAAHAPPGRDYELWIIDPSLGAPRSLGVIGDGRRGKTLGGLDPAVVQSATYAVTEEPPGGSPTGKPSGRARLRRQANPGRPLRRHHFSNVRVTRRRNASRRGLVEKSMP